MRPLVGFARGGRRVACGLHLMARPCPPCRRVPPRAHALPARIAGCVTRPEALSQAGGCSRQEPACVRSARAGARPWGHALYVFAPHHAAHALTPPARICSTQGAAACRGAARGRGAGGGVLHARYVSRRFCVAVTNSRRTPPARLACACADAPSATARRRCACVQQRLRWHLLPSGDAAASSHQRLPGHHARAAPARHRCPCTRDAAAHLAPHRGGVRGAAAARAAGRRDDDARRVLCRGYAGRPAAALARAAAGKPPPPCVLRMRHARWCFL